MFIISEIVFCTVWGINKYFMHIINNKAYSVYELKFDLFNFKTKGL